MQDIPKNPAASGGEDRWELLRDVLKFQLKLLIDGLRDVLMSPVSLVAAVAGLLLEPRHPGRYFEKALDFGRDTEEWINLFDRPPSGDQEPAIDELFGRLEARLVEQCDRGGLTSGAKRAIDGSLDRLHRALTAVRGPPAGEANGSNAQTAGDSDV